MPENFSGCAVTFLRHVEETQVEPGFVIGLETQAGEKFCFGFRGAARLLQYQRMQEMQTATLAKNRLRTIQRGERFGIALQAVENSASVCQKVE